MSRFGVEYDALCDWRSSQRCVDCEGRDGEPYTTVNNSRDVICRSCYGKRANDPKNPNFGRLNP